MVLEHLTLVTLTFDPGTPKIEFPWYPRQMCGISLSKVDQGVLELQNKSDMTRTHSPGFTSLRTCPIGQCL